MNQAEIEQKLDGAIDAGGLYVFAKHQRQLLSNMVGPHGFVVIPDQLEYGFPDRCQPGIGAVAAIPGLAEGRIDALLVIVKVVGGSRIADHDLGFR